MEKVSLSSNSLGSRDPCCWSGAPDYRNETSLFWYSCLLLGILRKGTVVCFFQNWICHGCFPHLGNQQLLLSSCKSQAWNNLEGVLSSHPGASFISAQVPHLGSIVLTGKLKNTRIQRRKLKRHSAFFCNGRKLARCINLFLSSCLIQFIRILNSRDLQGISEYLVILIFHWHLLLLNSLISRRR